MCDLHHLPGDELAEDQYVLDTPVVRTLVATVREEVARSSSSADACAALQPVFEELLARRDWLPEEFQHDVPESGMGGGIGQWLLYRAGDGRMELVRQRPLQPGDHYVLLPPVDDIHRVRTTSDVTSVSIHLLANDTGCALRHTFDEGSGEAKPFRSGYANAACPEPMTAE